MYCWSKIRLIQWSIPNKILNVPSVLSLVWLIVLESNSCTSNWSSQYYLRFLKKYILYVLFIYFIFRVLYFRVKVFKRLLQWNKEQTVQNLTDHFFKLLKIYNCELFLKIECIFLKFNILVSKVFGSTKYFKFYISGFCSF